MAVLTCVLPPELSWTAVLDSAVLAANDLKAAPNTLLTPNAMSSCGDTSCGVKQNVEYFQFPQRFAFTASQKRFCLVAFIYLFFCCGLVFLIYFEDDMLFFISYDFVITLLYNFIFILNSFDLTVL